MSNIMARPKIDDLDLEILRALQADGRATNKAIADALGIPVTTCLLRTRRLIELGVITGFYAEINPDMLGFSLQAIIAIRLAAHTRADNDRIMKKLLSLPGVLAVSLMSGDDDYLVQVVAESPEQLSDLVLDRITSDPAVAGSHTRLVFKHMRSRQTLVGMGRDRGSR